MKGDSLRIRLKHALEEKYPDYLTINEVEDICKEYHKKMSNAERRFRFDSKCPKLYIPNKRIWNEKGTAIIGYEWIGEAPQAEIPKVKIPIVGIVKNEKVIFDKPLRQGQMFETSRPY